MKNTSRFVSFLIRTGITAIVLFAAMIPATYAFADEPILTVPADITVEATSTNGANVIFSASASDTDTSAIIPVCIPPSNSLFALGTTTVICAATSAINVASTTQATFNIGVVLNPTETAYIAIRDNNTLLGPFLVVLPAMNAAPVPLTPTGSTTSYMIPARSVLALLSSMDTATSSFDITDLQYFSSFNSFLVNCIFVPAASATPDCFNWIYAVNGSSPFFGMDGYILQNGDAAYIFFGSQWQISTDKAAVSTGEPFTVTAEKYDPSSGLYVPASGEAVGAVQFDSNFTATQFATSTTDSSGNATLSVSAAGIYNIGIAGSGYFPNTSVTVSDPPPVSGGGGSGGNSFIFHHSIDTYKALQFLVAHQNTDGSFGPSLYTDWAAIAFGSGPPSAAKDKITGYLKGATDTLTSVTDYERRAMALLSLNINPYDGTGTNYIQKIIDNFDGSQIGSLSLVNDDIFATLPLIKSGYSADDIIIQKIITFIISKQQANGSWEGSVDLTAAAIQSLSLVPSIPSVGEAKTKARNYLMGRQQNDGGFGGGGSFSTSWALQAIAALSESSSQWVVNNNTPDDYLYSLQEGDGGLEPMAADINSRIWATAYAIPAAQGKPWAVILSSFIRPVATIFSGGGGGGILENTVATGTAASSSISLIVPENSTTTAKTAVLAPIIATIAPASSTPHSTAIKTITDGRQRRAGQTAAVFIAGEANDGAKTSQNIITVITHVISSFISNLLSVLWRW